MTTAEVRQIVNANRTSRTLLVVKEEHGEPPVRVTVAEALASLSGHEGHYGFLVRGCGSTPNATYTIKP